MKPNPFASLNHFTLPVAIELLLNPDRAVSNQPPFLPIACGVVTVRSTNPLGGTSWSTCRGSQSGACSGEVTPEAYGRQERRRPRAGFCRDGREGVRSPAEPRFTVTSPEPVPITGVRNRWALVLLAIALCGGVGICLYLTRFHEIEMYGDQSATLSNWPRTETTNCEVVNTSAYSEIGGVPISALGIPTYLLLLGFLLAAWSRPRP